MAKQQLKDSEYHLSSRGDQKDNQHHHPFQGQVYFKDLCPDSNETV